MASTGEDEPQATPPSSSQTNTAAERDKSSSQELPAGRVRLEAAKLDLQIKNEFLEGSMRRLQRLSLSLFSLYNSLNDDVSHRYRPVDPDDDVRNTHNSNSNNSDSHIMQEECTSLLSSFDKEQSNHLSSPVHPPGTVTMPDHADFAKKLRTLFVHYQDSMNQKQQQHGSTSQNSSANAQKHEAREKDGEERREENRNGDQQQHESQQQRLQDEMQKREEKAAQECLAAERDELSESVQAKGKQIAALEKESNGLGEALAVAQQKNTELLTRLQEQQQQLDKKREKEVKEEEKAVELQQQKRMPPPRQSVQRTNIITGTTTKTKDTARASPPPVESSSDNSKCLNTSAAPSDTALPNTQQHKQQQLSSDEHEEQREYGGEEDPHRTMRELTEENERLQREGAQYKQFYHASESEILVLKKQLHEVSQELYDNYRLVTQHPQTNQASDETRRRIMEEVIVRVTPPNSNTPPPHAKGVSGSGEGELNKKSDGDDGGAIVIHHVHRRRLDDKGSKPQPQRLQQDVSYEEFENLQMELVCLQEACKQHELKEQELSAQMEQLQQKQQQQQQQPRFVSTSNRRTNSWSTPASLVLASAAAHSNDNNNSSSNNSHSTNAVSHSSATRLMRKLNKLPNRGVVDHEERGFPNDSPNDLPLRHDGGHSSASLHTNNQSGVLTNNSGYYRSENPYSTMIAYNSPERTEANERYDSQLSMMCNNNSIDSLPVVLMTPSHSPHNQGRNRKKNTSNPNTSSHKTDQEKKDQEKDDDFDDDDDDDDSSSNFSLLLSPGTLAAERGGPSWRSPSPPVVTTTFHTNNNNNKKLGKRSAELEDEMSFQERLEEAVFLATAGLQDEIDDLRAQIVHLKERRSEQTVQNVNSVTRWADEVSTKLTLMQARDRAP